MTKLTPENQINSLKQRIDDLVQEGAPDDTIQAFINQHKNLKSKEKENIK